MTQESNPGVPAGITVKDDPALLAEGWTRRSICDPTRAKEMSELYTSVGFEVTTRSLTEADFGSGCTGCAQSACKAYIVLYTRPL